MANICVFCSSSGAIDESFIELAASVGTALARRGHDLVSGGGSVSMMGAVTRAAREGGSRTIGVIPEVLSGSEVADVESHELLITDDLRERKQLMSDRSDAFIVLPGGVGTLEELFDVWVARTLGLHAKPVVVCDPTGLFDGFKQSLHELEDKGFIRPRAFANIVWTPSVDEAVDAIESELGDWAFGDGERYEEPPTEVERDILEAES